MKTNNMVRLTSEDIRKKQLEMLQKVDNFLKNNQIQYFAFCGTLLGAVRHKGFIPWDNDIDIAVSRKDYIKMQRILKDEESNDYFRFLCYENDHRYLWQFGKIIAKGTYLKTRGGYSKLGLNIDVFPLDNQGDDYEAAVNNLKEAKKCARRRVMSYDKRCKGAFTYPKCSDDELEELKYIFEGQGKDSEEYWVKKHIALAQAFKGQDNSVYFGCNSNEKYTVVCERRFFESVEYLDFESIKVPAPIGYKEILTRYYGDYMKLPKKEMQVGLGESNIYLMV